jgi:hypothetical protein
MSYHSRIREIQSAFVMGYQDRETCISLFETLLHEYNLLPKEEQLDRTITNENFLALLKMAKDHRINAEAPANLQAQQRATGTEITPYRVANSVKQRCPICQKAINALFNRVQSLDNQIIPVDPPRCQECMMKWVAERFEINKSRLSEPAPTVTVDRTPASPMKPDEMDFFAFYEKQMEEEKS